MDPNQKTQVIERLRQAQNILIAVSNNPSVDQLASAVGLALLMTKLGKHTTAVFSGNIPSTIEFLKPEITLEKTTDSLRDFIISLDKAKADKLRYKVEEKVVKIFVTPYRTSLNQSDFTFEQGDYNVDVVVALGVDKQEHIDQAITAHGRILHNATVIGLMAGKATTDIGSINWIDAAASSLCEMIVSISESFQSGLLDNQMATAFLTGIVANTERFSNDKTTPKVMTMAAQLMAAGANQQLISDKLALPKEVPQEASIDLKPATVANQTQQVQAKPAPTAADTKQSTPVKTPTKKPSVPPLQQQEVKPSVKLPPAPSETESPPPPNEIKIDDQGTLYHVSELLDQNAAPTAASTILDKGPDIKPPEEPVSYSGYMKQPPQTGGTLTANTKPEDDTQAVDPFNVAPNMSPEATGTDASSAQTDGNGHKVVEQSMAKLEQAVKSNQQAPADAIATPDAETARQKVNEAANVNDVSGASIIKSHTSVKPLTPGPTLPASNGQPPAVPPPLPTPSSPDIKTVNSTPKKDITSPPEMPTPTQ